VRVEISLGFVVSLRPKGAAFGQAGSTRLDWTIMHGTDNNWHTMVFLPPWFQNMFHEIFIGILETCKLRCLLDNNRWSKRILHWDPGGERSDIARNTDLWFQSYTDFISFVHP